MLLKSILDNVAVLSLKFQSNKLLGFKVAPAVALSMERLTELIDNPDLLELTLDNAGIQLEEGPMTILLPKPGHMRKKPEHREMVEVEYNRMKQRGKMEKTMASLVQVVPTIIECLNDRFSSFNIPVFQKMRTAGVMARQIQFPLFSSWQSSSAGLCR